LMPLSMVEPIFPHFTHIRASAFAGAIRTLTKARTTT
jgi:hypothetical protein